MITISTLVLAAATALSAAQTGEAELTVSVTGIQQAGGQLVVGLYASGEDWDAGSAAAGQYVPVEGDSVSFTFADLPAGTYGIKLYHDVDGDGDMDTNLMGIPTEPFGFSNTKYHLHLNKNKFNFKLLKPVTTIYRLNQKGLVNKRWHDNRYERLHNDKSKRRALTRLHWVWEK